MAVSLTKLDPTCSNIQLIDQNACLGDSLPTINSNIINLSSGMSDLTRNITKWENFLTLFSVTSALMVQTMLNIQSINTSYISPYTTVQLLSSRWNKKIFSLYYPTFYDLQTYLSFVGTINDPKNDIILWLNTNFPTSSFADEQIVNVFLTLHYTNHFIFSYQANYQENCAPNRHTDTTLTCDGCAGGLPFAGCNHDAGGRHWCDNAYIYCQQTATRDAETYSCQGNTVATYDWTTVDNNPYSGYTPTSNNVPAGNLNIDYKHNGNDSFVARIISYTFQNINSTWV
jgi:hypothetical protein